MTVLTPERFLPHACGSKEAMPAVMTLETTNQVVPFSSVESSAATSRASKPDGCICSRHLPPPTETIVASP